MKAQQCKSPANHTRTDALSFPMKNGFENLAKRGVAQFETKEGSRGLFGGQVNNVVDMLGWTCPRACLVRACITRRARHSVRARRVPHNADAGCGLVAPRRRARPRRTRRAIPCPRACLQLPFRARTSARGVFLRVGVVKGLAIMSHAGETYRFQAASSRFPRGTEGTRLLDKTGVWSVQRVI